MTAEPRGLHAPFTDAVLRAIPLGALLVGDDGRVVAANPQFATVCGIEGVDLSAGASAEPIAEAMTRLLPDLDMGSVRALRSQFVRKAELKLRDGRTLRRSRQPIDTGDARLGVLWLVEDITGQRRYEDDLHRHIEALGELARDRAEFAARTSHELRTPLATVLTFCELLADPAAGTLSTAQREYVDTIRRGAQRMQDMADGLLHRYAEAATAPPAYAPLDPGPLLTRLVADTAPRAARGGVFLSLDLPAAAERPPLVADADRLERALAALLDNAVKFTPAGGAVAVTARPRDGGAHDGELPSPGWRFTVRDDGIGIPKEFQEEVFTEFVRAPNARRGPYPGTGLGLNDVRDAVRVHAGTVSVHSAEGHGTAMEVWLPAAGPPGAGTSRNTGTTRNDEVPGTDPA
ncbi:PAS domain-containing sensor histidine kinase [Streptomyces aurantiacus]|uniref:histidine kinase n=1 Tax=Streptomyces aurantiacus JA 4570 TaxID=1286094 RepID=S4AES6_9ACTN|nr:PAS domain-containing sensor histidine kinase [Streptomyces aurantiacus]EPH39977.1 putative Histidine protein kinase DivJ [Streptomyces aurantiacus JA 4570]